MAEFFVSTGSINSTIDIYKPDDFFQKGGVLTIVYEGVIVATINVYPNDSEQFFVGNNSKYLIQGSDISLRRLNRLCNLDVTNKGDYLRFNDSPAVVPKGLAYTEESSNSFFVTPKRDKDVFTKGTKYFKRFHQFDDMLDALEKVDVPGSPHAEPDVKTVYVLVSMHGEDKVNKLNHKITHKVHILPSGLCSAPLESPSEQLVRLEQFRKTNPDLIEEKYESDSRLRINSLKKNVERSLATGKHSEPLTRGLTAKQMPKRLAQYDELEKLHVGPLIQDREYTDDSAALVFTQCISILGTNWKKEEMMTPYGTFSADKGLSHKINTFYSPLLKPPVTQQEASDQLQQFQSLNLLNVEVLEKITTTMKGVNIPFERFKGMINGEVDRLTVSTQGTGIPHYTNVRLTHLLDLFEKLGFDKVVLFDEGCRTGNMYDTSGRAEAEKEAAEELGGRRTKRRRTRRSRRSHKKS